MVPREDSDLINGLNLAWISNLMTSLNRAVVEMRRWEVALLEDVDQRARLGSTHFP